MLILSHSTFISKRSVLHLVKAIGKDARVVVFAVTDDGFAKKVKKEMGRTIIYGGGSMAKMRVYEVSQKNERFK